MAKIRIRKQPLPCNQSSLLPFYRAMYCPSSLHVAEHHSPGAVTKSVYTYASMLHDILENPRQHTLDHDVINLLGSSDPPAGFGFQHPRFYNLQQKHPRPLEPLRVCSSRLKRTLGNGVSLFRCGAVITDTCTSLLFKYSRSATIQTACQCDLRSYRLHRTRRPMTGNLSTNETTPIA